MSEQYAALRGNVGLLGQLLGQTIKDAQGQAILFKIASRSCSKLSFRSSDAKQSLNSTCLLIIVRRVTSVGWAVSTKLMWSFESVSARWLESN